VSKNKGNKAMNESGQGKGLRGFKDPQLLPNIPAFMNQPYPLRALTQNQEVGGLRALGSPKHRTRRVVRKLAQLPS
jgi:hypothetical protein